MSRMAARLSLAGRRRNDDERPADDGSVAGGDQNCSRVASELRRVHVEREPEPDVS